MHQTENKQYNIRHEEYETSMMNAKFARSMRIEWERGEYFLRRNILLMFMCYTLNYISLCWLLLVARSLGSQIV